jgi:hypothetical protein
VTFIVRLVVAAAWDIWDPFACAIEAIAARIDAYFADRLNDPGEN